MSGAGQVFGALLVMCGLVLAGFAGYELALTTTGGGPQGNFDVTWAPDYTCGYGVSSVDCWAANESLDVDAAALTVMVKLDIIKGTASIQPRDVALKFTVKNDAPPFMGTNRNEIPAPVYLQVTSFDGIVSDLGISIPIVGVDAYQRYLIGDRNLAGTDFLIGQEQTVVGTMLSGASGTAYLDFQLRPSAFTALAVSVGQEWHVRGTLAGHSFDVTIRASTVA